MFFFLALRWTRFALRLGSALLLTTTAFADEREQLDDLSARIQFDYFAADARALQHDLQSLKQLTVPESTALLRQYYLVYGHLKLAETLAEKNHSAARKAAGVCVDISHEVIDQEPKRQSSRERAQLDTLYGELWAMQAACAFIVAEQGITVAIWAGNNAREKAASLAPNSPRVQLLAAIHFSQRAKSQAERAEAHAKIISAVELFDSAPPVEPGLPDWGQAEALAWLGLSQLQRGDRMAARNTLERALVIAPDYAWARTLQTQLKSPH